MIPGHVAQQIKDAAQVEEVVGQFVDLKRKGARFLALCPFHNEKTPSFNVTPALGIYKCFGCGEAGDSVSFLMRHEHLSYPDALRWLAQRYNIEVVEEEATPEQKLEQDERESLSVINTFAQRWSEEQLWNTDVGRRIGLSYCKERGFSEATIKEFGLGYVPESGHAFADAARQEGYKKDLLEKSGWIKLREDGTAWDFFQGRVTFPIHGLSGQVIAFGARTLRSDKKLPKYFNSPESLLYVKSRSLYGIFQARRPIAENDLCYLVEGYTDVISLHQAGVHNVVASSGTSLTTEQIRLIRRYTTHITILYDGDPAGLKASLRGIDMILAEGMHVKVVLFPEGEDPDSFARKHDQDVLFAFLRDEAKDLITFKAGLLMRDSGSDPVRKAESIHDIVSSIAKVPDHVLRSLYIKQCSTILEVQEQALLSELNKELRKGFRKELGHADAHVEQIEPSIRPVQPDLEDLGTQPQEYDIIRLLLNYGQKELSVGYEDDDGELNYEDLLLAHHLMAELKRDDMEMTDPVLQRVFLHYKTWIEEGVEDIHARLTGHSDMQVRELCITLLSERHALSSNWLERHRIHTTHESDRLLAAVDEAVHILKERRVDKMLRDIQDKLRDATTDDEINSFLLDQVRLIEAKKALAKQTGRVVVG